MDNTKDVADAITIFISYALQDEALLYEFEKHLALLRKQGSENVFGFGHHAVLQREEHRHGVPITLYAI